MKMLLVTFPVDFGSSAYEKRFVTFFSSAKNLDVKVFRFAASEGVSHPNSIFSLAYFLIFLGRFKSTIALERAVRDAQSENRKILFMGVSPAMYAYFFLKRNTSYIVIDWTRKLYEPLWGRQISPKWLTLIHKKVFNSQRYILGLTEIISKQIVTDYNVLSKKVKKVKVPFSVDLNIFVPSTERRDSEIRILFVGGDFHRKGGDVLFNWFIANQRCANIFMTMVTGHSLNIQPGVNITQAEVKYGDPEHVELFRDHDIFVLPTTCDAYPSVLGEAACAGLAILTTKNALGSPEIIQDGFNGYICNSQAELMDQLTILVKDKPLVENMKRNSRAYMEKEFCFDLALSEYIQYIYD